MAQPRCQPASGTPSSRVAASTSTGSAVDQRFDRTPHAHLLDQVDTPALLGDRIRRRADPGIHRLRQRSRQGRNDADAVRTERQGGVDQERQPLALRGPQGSSDHRQGDVPRDGVFCENAIDRILLGRELILAGEPEEGRSEDMLPERAKDVPRCERVVDLRLEHGERLLHGPGHPPDGTLPDAGPQPLGLVCRERGRSEVTLPIERGDDLRHHGFGRHAVSLAEGVHSAHAHVEGGGRAHDDLVTDPAGSLTCRGKSAQSHKEST